MVTALLVSLALAVGQPAPAPPPAAPADRPAGPAAAQDVPGARTAAAASGLVTDYQDGWTATPPAPAGPASPAGPAAVQDAPATPGPTALPGVVPAAAYGSPAVPAPPGPSATPSDQAAPKPPEKPYRRGLPAPLDSPPFPTGEWQGYPLVGVPPDTTMWPLQKALQGTWYGDLLNSERVRIYGWANASFNLSKSSDSNMPDSYWIFADQLELDQLVLRVERQVDSVQTDHWDWGFRSTLLYGIDYRYMTAGGWFSDQLLLHNRLYGADPTEQYVDIYTPGVAEGMIVRVGRWIACPDIETQFAPDNYLGTHSLLFTFDTYTQTGVMATIMLSDQWTFQACIHSGTDMAPWYKGALPTGMFGLRWVSASNNDSIYTVLNSINNGKFRYFTEHDIPSGHDNFNYVVTTWQHKFNEIVHTKTEAYYMWQFDAVLGGTPSLGPVQRFGGGGGLGAPIPGTSRTYGVLNYTMFEITKRDFITFRNEWWRDEEGERSGFPSTYTSNTVGLTHNFNQWLQIRPEIGFYRSWLVPAFDNGTRKNMLMGGFDVTLRF